MLGTDPLGIRALGTSDGTIPPLPPAAALLTQATLDVVYLVEIYAYDPDAEAEAPIYVSDRGYITAPDDDPQNRVYAPRLDLPPYFERSIPVSPEDGFRARLTIGELGLSNADGAFDDAVRRYAIDGRRVVVRLGSPGFAFADFVTLFDGTAAAWRRADDGSVRLDLRDVGYRVEKPIQQTLYEGGGGLEGTADLQGKPKPLVYGYAGNVTATPVDPARLIYQVHDGPVRAITAVYDAGLPLANAGDVEDIRSPVIPSPSTQELAQVSTELPPFAMNATVPNVTDGLLLVSLMFRDGFNPVNGDVNPGEFSSVTWRGIALTRIGRQWIKNDTLLGGQGVELWGLLNPPPGAGTIVADVLDEPNTGEINGLTMLATVLADVNQETGWGTPVTDTGVGSQVGDVADVELTAQHGGGLVWAVLAQRRDNVPVETFSYTPGPGITEHLDTLGNGHAAWVGSKVALSPGVQSMSATLAGEPNEFEKQWAMLAVEILPSPTPAGYFVTAVAQGMFRLGDTPVGTVTADVEGDATDGAFAASTSQIAQRILADRSDSDIAVDGASLIALQTLQPAPVGIAITDEIRTAAGILDELMAGIAGWWGPDRLGRIQFGRLDAPTGTGLVTLRSTDILELEMLAMPESVDPPNWRRRVAWGRNWTVQTSGLAATVTAERKAFLAEPFRVATDADENLRQIFRNASDPAPLPGLFRDAGAAKVEAQRLRGLYGVRRRLFRIVCKLKPALIEPGQSIVVDDPRHGLAGGVSMVVVLHRIDCDRSRVTLHAMA